MDDAHLSSYTTTIAAVLLLTAAQQLIFSPPVASVSPYSCDWCPRRHAAASPLPPHAHLAGGACGLGAAELELSGGHIAAVAAGLFRDGDGCGACYQLRCRDRRLCGENGVKVVVADVIKEEDDDGKRNYNQTTGLLFLVSKDAFTAMVKGDSISSYTAHDQLTGGFDDTLQVDFRRIPCEYSKKNKNLAVRVEEGSRNPGHLAIKLLYQGGVTDITAVEVAQVLAGANANAMTSSWRYMTPRRRIKGSAAAQNVWSTSRAPAGALRLRLVVTAGSGGKWLRNDGEVLPTDWRPGQVYDTGLRVTDVAVRACALSCGDDGGGEEDDDEGLR